MINEKNMNNNALISIKIQIIHNNIKSRFINYPFYIYKM